MNLDLILNNDRFTREEVIYLLSLSKKEEIRKIINRADAIRKEMFGDQVHVRGLIEFSNYCVQNCSYCGLREDNYKITRYRMTPDEIIETAKVVSNFGVTSIVLQSGEDFHYDSDMISFIIYSIKQKTEVSLSLCLGERGFDEYRAWKIAGADRYILKYETSNPDLYYAHHSKQQLEERIQHLRFLKTIGYKIGTGNLVGLPNQSIEDLADDILLCKELDVDMAAFSPFIPASNTPYQNKSGVNSQTVIHLMAVARIVLRNIHIPSTSALGSIDDTGREKGLSAGADIVMPNFTPLPYRSLYKIYEGNKDVQQSPFENLSQLQKKIESIERKVSFTISDPQKQAAV